MPQYWHLVQNNGHIGTYSYILDHISGILIHIWPYFWLICSYWAVSVNIWNGNTRHAQQACMHTSTSMYAYMPVHANISQMHIHLVGLVQSSRVIWILMLEWGAELWSVFVYIDPYFVTNMRNWICSIPYWNINMYK